MVILSVGGLSTEILNLIKQWSDRRSLFAISDIKLSLCNSFVVKLQSCMFPALCVWRVTFWNRSNNWLFVSLIRFVNKFGNSPIKELVENQ